MKKLPPEAIEATDEMLDAAQAAAPYLYRVDAMRAIEAALKAIPANRWVDADELPTDDGYSPRDFASY